MMYVIYIINHNIKNTTMLKFLTNNLIFYYSLINRITRKNINRKLKY